MAQGGRGRPLLYKNAEELEAACNRYFDACRGHYRRDDAGGYVLDKQGRPIVDDARPLTVTGLQMALGFKSRQSLLDYGGRQAFAPIIQRARLRIENYAEERLFDRDGYRGACWVLSVCFGWGRDPAADEKPVPVVRVLMDA